MARIRSIKPEFWQDEKLAKVSRDARLLFIGLWNLADDEGRLRGAPAFIRAQIFAYDGDVDVEQCLQQLANIGCIERYEDDGQSFIWVRNFSEHQKIDARQVSRLPAPLSGRAPPKKRRAPPKKSLGAGSREQGVEQGVEQGTGGESADRVALLDLPKEILPGRRVEDLQRAWNDLTALPLPRWEQTPKPRRAAALAAIERRSLEGDHGWAAVFARIGRSGFCRGEDGGWKASVDWALRPEGKKPETALLVLEGKYDRATGPPAGLKDITRGTVTAESQKHLHNGNGEHGF